MHNHRTSFQIEDSYRFRGGERYLDLLVRLKTGKVREGNAALRSARASKRGETAKRTLTVDSIDEDIFFSDDLWTDRERPKGTLRQIAHVFLYPFEIGNLESLQRVREGYEAYRKLHLGGKYWKHAAVGIRSGNADASATECVRQWAIENEFDYFEITLDDGSSVEELLTELIRIARLLPEKPHEMLEGLCAQALAGQESAKRSGTPQRSSDAGGAPASPSPREGCVVM